MTLDYYLVRHDRKETFHLCDHRSDWNGVFPVTRHDRIERFGKHLLGQLPALLEKSRAESARLFPVPADPDDDFDLASFDTEIIRRIRAWATDAPGIYCISDDGDHMDFVYTNHYRVTGTGFGRRVGAWWLDTYEWPRVTSQAAWVAAHRDDGANLKMAFQWVTEASKVYHQITTLELEAALERNPKRARG